MAEFTASHRTCRATAHASLAVLGVKLWKGDLLGPIREKVKIDQKTVQYTPFEKLMDALITILAGARGMVEVNEGLRADPALQRAFGRKGCAEQSVIQDTLDACTPANVAQMEAAWEEIFRTHSQAVRHDYLPQRQLLDVDFSGCHCGKQAEGATKGYFDQKKNRRGRQLGRVVATRYEEIVVDQLYPGNTQLMPVLTALMAAAEQRLGLTAEQKRRTIVRMDAGGGSVENINWLLERGYQVHAKDCSGLRAKKLAKSVTRWLVDPARPGRQVGWVEAEAAEYVRPVRRLAVRCRQPNGQWALGIVISTLTPEAVWTETRQAPERQNDPDAVMLAYADFYDDRGGGVETSVKGSKQGLGITKRNKKRFAAQQMVGHLNALAQNVLVWARGWLEPEAPRVRFLGVKRLIRDLFGIRGLVETQVNGQVDRIILNQSSPLARHCLSAFQRLLSTRHVAVILGET